MGSITLHVQAVGLYPSNEDIQRKNLWSYFISSFDKDLRRAVERSGINSNSDRLGTTWRYSPDFEQAKAIIKKHLFSCNHYLKEIVVQAVGLAVKMCRLNPINSQQYASAGVIPMDHVATQLREHLS